jgi:exonuclease III
MRAPDERLRLVSWNIAGRVRRQPEQVACLSDAAADVLCLQEVRASTLAPWKQALCELGYAHIEHAPLDLEARVRRPLAVLTASRAPMSALEQPPVPWPERVLAVRLAHPGLEIVNLHSPISPSPQLAKVRTHEVVHEYLARGGDVPRILCGDLNTPRKEHPDGSIWTFARSKHGKLRPERGERWDRAELALIRGLEPHGYRDAFRALHGPERRALSWVWPRWGGGYRLDHLIASEGVAVLHCEYEHGWREQGLSDHAALIADLVVSARPLGRRPES